MQDIPAATESAGQAAAAVDGVFHVLTAGEEAEQEDQDHEQQEGVSLAWGPDLSREFVTLTSETSQCIRSGGGGGGRAGRSEPGSAGKSVLC